MKFGKFPGGESWFAFIDVNATAIVRRVVHLEGNGDCMLEVVEGLAAISARFTTPEKAMRAAPRMLAALRSLPKSWRVYK